jgi:hypothetical protein
VARLQALEAGGLVGSVAEEVVAGLGLVAVEAHLEALILHPMVAMTMEATATMTTVAIITTTMRGPTMTMGMSTAMESTAAHSFTST